MYIAYIVYYYICLPLCVHILYFDAAKLSIKEFSFIYFTLSDVRQWNEYEKEREREVHALGNQDLACQYRRFSETK